MPRIHRLLTGLVCCLSVLFPLSCARRAPSGGPRSEFALGTICTVNLFERGSPELYSRVFARLRELEDILSANREGSDLDKVNKNAGLGPVRTRPELPEVLEKALGYAEKSGGVFDPSIGPLVKLWRVGTEDARVPRGEEINEALRLIDYREIEIARAEGSVFLRRPGMALDLGAIAKGYAADEIAALLAEEGVERGIIDLGGNILALGAREENSEDEDSYWRVGIQDPRDRRGNYIGVLRVKNKSVVTSGVYERFFEENGKRYHHIFSTEDGLPIQNRLLSVTIAAGSSVDADALSTTAFALGWEKGRALIEEINGAAGIFVFDDLSVRLTDGIEKDFSLNAAEYRLAD